MPTQATYADKIKKYLPDFVTVSEQLDGLIKGIAKSFLTAYNFISTIKTNETTQAGMRLLGEEERLLFSGHETTSEMQARLQERFTVNSRRGTINGILSDLAYLMNYRNGRYCSLDGASEYAYSGSADFNIKSGQLLSNGDFETGTLGQTPASWTCPTANVVKDNTNVHGGTYAAKMTVPVSGTSSIYQDVTAQSRRYYSIVLWFNIPIGRTATLKLQRTKAGTTAQAITIATATLTGTGAYARATAMIQFPDKTEDDILRIRIEGTGGAGTYYFDDILLQEDYEITIGSFVKVDSTGTGDMVLFHKADAIQGKGYGLTLSPTGTIRFHINDGSNTQEVSAAAIDYPDKWNLIAVTMNGSTIRLLHNGTVVATAARTVYGDIVSANNFTLYRSSASASNYMKALAGDLQFLRGYSDPDLSVVTDWNSRGMLIDWRARALWRWNSILTIGLDQSQNGNNLSLVNITSADIGLLTEHDKPNGYPSFPSYRAYQNDPANNRAEVGWFADRTFPDVDKTLMFDAEAVMEIEIIRDNILTKEKTRQIIRKEIMPIDVQYLEAE